MSRHACAGAAEVLAHMFSSCSCCPAFPPSPCSSCLTGAVLNNMRGKIGRHSLEDAITGLEKLKPQVCRRGCAGA